MLVSRRAEAATLPGSCPGRDGIGLGPPGQDCGMASPAPLAAWPLRPCKGVVNSRGDRSPLVAARTVAVAARTVAVAARTVAVTARTVAVAARTVAVAARIVAVAARIERPVRGLAATPRMDPTAGHSPAGAGVNSRGRSGRSPRKPPVKVPMTPL